ncbi:hypothetical protein XA39_04245 [Acinetobacter tandoii]|nr:hypothetical protein XA39_04245 [Acinetobacter tandoii]
MLVMVEAVTSIFIGIEETDKKLKYYLNYKSIKPIKIIKNYGFTYVVKFLILGFKLNKHRYRDRGTTHEFNQY